jgi:hypothetical protein
MRNTTEKQGSWFSRHKILTGILGLIVLFVIIGAASGGSDSDKTNDSNDKSSNSSKSKKEETVAKIGEAARDGKFEFTVTAMKCGETTVGTNEYLQEKAQGQFCRISMTIKNIGDEAQSMFADNQKLVDTEGKEYSYDSSATIYASSGSSTWYDQINPGNTVMGDIFFDVPADVTPVTALLHDSMYSGGVKVTLQ